MSSPATEPGNTLQFSPIQKFIGHTDSVTGVIHLPGGERIITSSQDGSLRLWSMENGLKIREEWQDSGSPVHAIALSPDGRRVASGSEDGAVRLWDIHTQKMVAKWTGHAHAVESVYWSEEGRRVVSGCYCDGTVREWDVESGESILGPLKVGQSFMTAFAYSPKKELIATAGIGGSRILEEIWNIKTRRRVTTLKLHEETHTGLDGITRIVWNVSCFAWTADRKNLVSGSNNCIIVRDCLEWEVIALYKVGSGLTPSLTAIAISPNARILAFASPDGGGLVNLENGQIIVGAHNQSIASVALSTDGKLLSVGHGERHGEESNQANVEDNIACTFDIVAILKKLGLEQLLLNKTPEDDDKPVIRVDAADATLPSLQQSANIRRIPAGFFDDARSRSSHLSPRFEPTAHERSTLNWTRALFSGQLLRRNQPNKEQHQLAVVETPYTRGQARNIKVTRDSKKIVPAPSNIMTINVPGPSRPPNSTSGMTQQSNGDASSQNPPLPSQAEAAATTASAGMAPLHSEPASDDVMVIRQVGCWTRFRLFLCCISAEKHP